MGAIAEMAERVIVMYAGRKVEDGPVGDILSQPLHPYTRGLIRCVPHLEAVPSAERHDLEEIPGVVPGLMQLGRPGCPFAPRCAERNDACAVMPGEFASAADHHVSCWVAEAGR